jgi:hypothetical protein
MKLNGQPPKTKVKTTTPPDKCYVVVNGMKEVVSVVTDDLYGDFVGNALHFKDSLWKGFVVRVSDPMKAADAVYDFLDKESGG